MSGRLSMTDRIRSVEPISASSKDLILPGLIDLQLNGAYGIDVMQADAASLRSLAAKLASVGTTGFLPTAITSPTERIEAVHQQLADAMQSQASDGGAGEAAILGLHLEGPFISPRRLGAHPRLSLDPTGEAFERVARLSKLRLLTLAPELDGALTAIARLRARGVIVSLGHSDADFEQTLSAIDAGARMFTHLFNGMRPLHHREPGIIGAALRPARDFVAVIPDGVHLHPEVLRLIKRVRGVDGMILVSDSILLAGSPASESAAVKVEGGAARLADGTLAGSIISLLEGVRLMVERCDASAAEAAVMAATNPARLLGLSDRGAIERGTRADLLVLDRALALKAIFVGGREI